MMKYGTECAEISHKCTCYLTFLVPYVHKHIIDSATTKTTQVKTKNHENWERHNCNCNATTKTTQVKTKNHENWERHNCNCNATTKTTKVKTKNHDF